MNSEPKLRKKTFTTVEQAIHQVRGFRNLYQELDDKIRLISVLHKSPVTAAGAAIVWNYCSAGKRKKELETDLLRAPELQSRSLSALWQGEIMHTIETLLPGRPPPAAFIAKQKSIIKITASWKRSAKDMKLYWSYLPKKPVYPSLRALLQTQFRKYLQVFAKFYACRTEIVCEKIIKTP